MSTLEALNAISEAITAHAKLPEVERSLREAQENCDWKTLELDEANKIIAELRETIAAEANINTELKAQLRDRNNQITELRDRNNMLDDSLNDAQSVIRNQEQRIIERELENKSLTLTKESLEARLTESKSYGTKLAETLRSIGASIVAAVEVPEVTSEAPFPVANPVAMPDSPSDQSNDQSRSEPDGLLAEPTDADLVGVAEDNSSSFNTPPASPGCYTSPIPPAKLWWEN
jgi:hypothetical protein